MERKLFSTVTGKEIKEGDIVVPCSGHDKGTQFYMAGLVEGVNKVYCTRLTGSCHEYNPKTLNAVIKEV